MKINKLYFKPSFIRQLKKLPPALQDESKEKISLFKENPEHPFLKTHKLKGKLAGFYSFSVNYQYRIIFKYLSKDKIVLLAVGNHTTYN